MPSNRIYMILLLAAINLLVGCNALKRPSFTAPAKRSLPATEQPWPKNKFISIAWHDIDDGAADQRYLSVRSSALSNQFAWLKENGYQPVSVDQILTARNGGAPLPPKAVVLVFDDGYSSFQTRALPLLKAYNWPAVWAVVGKWIDTPLTETVDFGGLPTPRQQFSTWQQIAEVSNSGLVEIASHTYDLHHGVLANPQGNTEPAAANLKYDPINGKYETSAQFSQRIEEDVIKISERIHAATGKPARVWVWPYGAANGTTISIMRKHGYQMAMTLEDGLGSVNDLYNVPRLLINNNPSLEVFARQVIAMQDQPIMRVAHIDLDYLYDPDPIQQERNLDKLIQRAYDLRISTVFVQAFADPRGDGNVKQVYFPNRWVPMRADLFNRAVWQLRMRVMGLKVYAWMPVLSYELESSLPRVQAYDPVTGETVTDSEQYHRLSPFNAQARQRIIEIYEDMARSAPIDGILFHDDAILTEDEDASPDAIAAYKKAGFPASIAEIHKDPEQLALWTRYKSQYLIGFTKTLTERVKAIRGGQIKSARNMYVLPILQPDSESRFAQNFNDFLNAYDWVVPMAMPYMEKIPENKQDEWLANLVKVIALYPDALSKTVFELQTKDWNKSGDNAISGKQLAHWMGQLQLNGAQNFGYYPDDFIRGEPEINAIRPVMSSAWNPLP